MNLVFISSIRVSSIEIKIMKLSGIMKSGDCTFSAYCTNSGIPERIAKESELIIEVLNTTWSNSFFVSLPGFISGI